MMRKLFNLSLSLAMLVTAGLTTASCTDSIDNPSVPQSPSEEPVFSAVDNGKWTVDESYVDNTIRPGDDFYMHRIGKWWEATSVDDDPSTLQTAGFMEDIVEAIRAQFPSYPNYDYLKKHISDLDAQAEAAQAFSAQAEKDCGLAKAVEDALLQGDVDIIWQCIGKMMAMGAPVPFYFEPLSDNGKAVLLMGANDNSFPLINTASYSKLIRDNAEFLKALRPLVSKTGTRGVDSSQWPHLVTMLKAAGIDPSYVFLLPDHPLIKMGVSEKEQKQMDQEMAYIKSLHDADLLSLPLELATYNLGESAIYSEENFAEAQSELAKSGQTFTKDKIVNFYYNSYMMYEESKIVGEQLVTPALRQEGIERCKELIGVFADRIKANQWLSDAGKQSALEKLDNIIINVGCPEKWIEEAIPDLSQSKSAVEDAFLLRKAAFNFMKYVAGKPLKEVSFDLLLAPNSENPLSQFNAFYARSFNSINIFPYWLRQPLYDATANQAVNYGFLAVTGHEITHGFDSGGYQFNKVGDPVSIFTNPADEAAFKSRSDALVKRFDELDIMVIPGTMSKGEYCLAENIADLGGVEIAFDAYTRYLQKNGFAGDELRKQQQRFFYTYTELWRKKYGPNFALLRLNGDPSEGITPDTHSLSRERVNGVVRNVDSWYDLFGIQSGDKLYLAPADRVHIW